MNDTLWVIAHPLPRRANLLILASVAESVRQRRPLDVITTFRIDAALEDNSCIAVVRRRNKDVIRAFTVQPLNGKIERFQMLGWGEQLPLWERSGTLPGLPIWEGQGKGAFPGNPAPPVPAIRGA
jgi:hypothetical protein